MFIWVKFGFEGSIQPKIFNTNVGCNILADAVKRQCLKEMEDYIKTKENSIRQTLRHVDQDLHHLNVKSNKHEDGLSSDQQNVQTELQTRQEVLRSQQDALVAASRQIHGLETAVVDLCEAVGTGVGPDIVLGPVVPPGGIAPGIGAPVGLMETGHPEPVGMVPNKKHGGVPLEGKPVEPGFERANIRMRGKKTYVLVRHVDPPPGDQMLQQRAPPSFVPMLFQLPTTPPTQPP